MGHFTPPRIAAILLALLVLQISLSPPAAWSQVTSLTVATPNPSGSTASFSAIPFDVSGGNRSVIFLLGLGDAGLSGKLVASLSNRLKQYELLNKEDIYLAAAPWSISDYLADCRSDPANAGALITSVVATAIGGRDALVYRRLTVQLAAITAWVACLDKDPSAKTDSGAPDRSANILYPSSCVQYVMRHSVLDWISQKDINQHCAPPSPPPDAGTTSQKDASSYVFYPKYCLRRTLHHLSTLSLSQQTLNNQCTLATPAPNPKPKGYPAIQWVSPVEYSNDTTRPAEVLPPTTLLLALAGVYETFVSSKMNSTSTTTVFPTSAPIPRTGEVGSITTLIGSAFNPGATLGALASGLYAQSISYQNNAFALPDTDEQSWRAAQGVVSLLVGSMNCKLKPSPTPAPVPTWPAYNSTSYPEHSKRSLSAPFCNDKVFSESSR